MNVQDLSPGDHAIAVSDTPAEQAHVLAAFVHDGLERGERVLYFSHRESQRVVAAGLRRRGIDVEGAVDGGRLMLATADATYLRAGAFDAEATKAAWFGAIAQTVASGFNIMRVAADMNWAAENIPGAQNLASYESAIADVFATGHVIGLCEFNRDAFAPDVIDELTHLHAVHVHSHEVASGPGFDISLGSAPGRITVGGEIDFYNCTEFEAALDAALEAFKNEGREIDIDLKHLRFIDAKGVRALLRCARRLQPLKRVLLRGTRPHIRRTFVLLKIDAILSQ